MRGEGRGVAEQFEGRAGAAAGHGRLGRGQQVRLLGRGWGDLGLWRRRLLLSHRGRGDGHSLLLQRLLRILGLGRRVERAAGRALLLLPRPRHGPRLVLLLPEPVQLLPRLAQLLLPLLHAALRS